MEEIITKRGLQCISRQVTEKKGDQHCLAHGGKKGSNKQLNASNKSYAFLAVKNQLFRAIEPVWGLFRIQINTI